MQHTRYSPASIIRILDYPNFEPSKSTGQSTNIGYDINMRMRVVVKHLFLDLILQLGYEYDYYNTKYLNYSTIATDCSTVC